MTWQLSVFGAALQAAGLSEAQRTLPATSTDKLAWPGTTATGVRAAIIFMINKIKMIDYYNPSA